MSLKQKLQIFLDEHKNASFVKHLKSKQHKDLYEEILSYQLDIDLSNIQEKIYWIVNDQKEFPRCPICSGKLSFWRLPRGYSIFCSVACANKSEKHKKNIKQTKLSRYGNEKYTNIEACKKTKLERYRNENYNNMEQIKRTGLAVGKSLSGYKTPNYGLRRTDYGC